MDYYRCLVDSDSQNNTVINILCDKLNLNNKEKLSLLSANSTSSNIIHSVDVIVAFTIRRE